jgi:hypothetical protein
MKTGEQLCLACGLCCDGTLFGHVRIGPGDQPEKLRALGLPVAASRAKTPLVRSLQPCAALCADRTCRLYADRPQQCRNFECGVFKALRAGRIEFAAALRLVRRARRQADQVRRLLRALGDTAEHRALISRFERMQRHMESGGADEAAGTVFAELSLAMHRLNLLTHEKFYTKADAGGGCGQEPGGGANPGPLPLRRCGRKGETLTVASGRGRAGNRGAGC